MNHVNPALFFPSDLESQFLRFLQQLLGCVWPHTSQYDPYHLVNKQRIFLVSKRMMDFQHWGTGIKSRRPLCRVRAAARHFRQMRKENLFGPKILIWRNQVAKIKMKIGDEVLQVSETIWTIIKSGYCIQHLC